MKMLFIYLQKIFGDLGKNVLRSLGLGLASGAGALLVINYYIDKITTQAGALGDMASILHLAGMDTALSIIIGAIITRATLGAAKVSITKAK